MLECRALSILLRCFYIFKYLLIKYKKEVKENNKGDIFLIHGFKPY